jgi:hypothetical protein
MSYHDQIESVVIKESCDQGVLGWIRTTDGIPISGITEATLVYIDDHLTHTFPQIQIP